jgi:hypothetical protein
MNVSLVGIIRTALRNDSISSRSSTHDSSSRQSRKRRSGEMYRTADHLRRMAIGTIGSGGGIDAVLMTRALERTVI